MKYVSGYPHERDYRNWYVLSTICGSERKIKEDIEILFKDRFHLYLPSRELLHTTGGDVHRVVMPMFPGYLFIHRKIEMFIRDIRHSHLTEYVYPILIDHKFAMVHENEMKFLMRLTDPDGLVRISEGMIDENQMVKIIRGPLKNLTGRILFYNKRKKKVKIKVEMLNQEVTLTLGFDLVEN